MLSPELGCQFFSRKKHSALPPSKLKSAEGEILIFDFTPLRSLPAFHLPFGE